MYADEDDAFIHGFLSACSSFQFQLERMPEPPEYSRIKPDPVAFSVYLVRMGNEDDRTYLSSGRPHSHHLA